MTEWLSLSRGWTVQRDGSPAMPAELPHLPWLAGPNGENHWFGTVRNQRVLPADVLASALGSAPFSVEVRAGTWRAQQAWPAPSAAAVFRFAFAGPPAEI